MRCRRGLFDNVPTPTAHPSLALGPIDNGAGAVVGISGFLLLREAADNYRDCPQRPALRVATVGPNDRDARGIALGAFRSTSDPMGHSPLPLPPRRPNDGR